MKYWLFGAITVVCALSAGVAAACPVGADDPRPQRPVVQNVSLQASQMFERASRLESVAASHDESARTLEREAETLANRARILRNQATFVAVADRPSLQAVADELAIRAAEDRSQASSERAQAAELRAQARALRDRALQLVRGNGGGGWRGKRGGPRDFALPPSTSSATTI